MCTIILLGYTLRWHTQECSVTKRVLCHAYNNNGFAFQNFIEPHVISTTKQNINSDLNKKTYDLTDFNTDRLFVQRLRDKLQNTKVVVTRAGRLQEWSQGEFRL